MPAFAIVIGGAGTTFFEERGARERVDDFHKKKVGTKRTLFQLGAGILTELNEKHDKIKDF